MTLDENYAEKLVNIVAKTIVEAFGNLTIADVNMYRLGYTKAIDDFARELHNRKFDNEYGTNIVLIPSDVEEIAEQLKEGSADNE